VIRAAPLLLAAFLALCATGSDAAELRGDSVFLCDAERQPSAPLKPSLLQPQLLPYLRTGDFAAAYRVVAEKLGAAVAADRDKPEVKALLAILRNPGRRTFGIDADGDTEKFFRAAPADTLTIDCRGAVARHLVDVSTASLLAERIRVRQNLPAERRRAENVRETAQDAEGLLANGLAMWPWELWLNGLRLSPSDAEPLFRTQWVALRPTAGIEIDTRNRAAADLNASVMLEPVGFVRYRGTGYSHWWGVSAVVTSSTRRGAGIGGLFRWDNYVIGLTRHKGEGKEPDSTFVLVGVDLYDALNRKRAAPRDWDGLEKLRDAVTP
jgi:hypothetical protein